MVARNMQGTIRVRQDTAENWESKNSVLAAGEFGFDTTNYLLKIGDGVTAWVDLTAIKFDGASVAAYSYIAEEATKANGYTRGGEIDRALKSIIARLDALEGGN